MDCGSCGGDVRSGGNRKGLESDGRIDGSLSIMVHGGGRRAAMIRSSCRSLIA